MLQHFQQIDDNSFENILLYLDFEDQLSLRLLDKKLNQRCLMVWRRVRSLELKYTEEKKLSKNMINYIIDLRKGPHSFTYEIFRFMRNLTTLVIDHNTMFMRLSLRDRECSSDIVLRALKGCPKVNSLSCIGVPLTRQIFARLMIKRRLRNFCFDTVKEDAVTLVYKLLECSMFLINLSIPQFVTVSDNMHLSAVVRVWDVPTISVCLREWNVGGLG